LHRDVFHDGINELSIPLLQFLSGKAMKKRALIFVSVAVLALMLVPVINFIHWGTVQKKEGKKWWSRSILYNFDFALSFTNRLVYPLGISTIPKEVVIGKDDWLYLGDQHENTITVTRRGTTAEDAEAAWNIGLATKSWQQWLKSNGVRLYRVMLGPDKSTIYPEFLPDWAQPAADSATNTLLANVRQGIYVDTRPALRAAKTQSSEPLYYKTDTHWNSLGAWVAFRAFAMEVARTEAGLRWLPDQHVHVAKVIERHGGDLGRILRMPEMLRDSEVVIEIDSEHPIETEQYDFETGHLTLSGGNPRLGPQNRPVLVKSKHALNQKKVLWLRDSFGTAMAPFMAATFTETLQLFYRKADPALFARLVETYKPDYVFITVVERDARNKWFESLPSFVTPVSGKPKQFISLSHGSPSGINDLTKVERSETYRISGADPFVMFTLINQVLTLDASQLVFELNCGEKKEPVRVQIFWHSAGTVFSEANSVHFATNPGITAIDLSPNFSWIHAGAVTDVRIDIDSSSACPILTINNLELGK
jgi:alginate O-acetyltransferase complex protein AlgJ